MATVNEALYELLTANAGVAALVGDRVYPVKMPQKAAFPAIVYAKSGGARSHSNDGSSGFNRAVFALDCWAASLAQASAVANAVRLAVDGYRGTVLGVDFNGVFLVGEEEGWDDDRAMAYASLDLEVLHNEPNPTP